MGATTSAAPAAPTSERSTSVARVAAQLALRNLVGVVRMPSTFVPSLVMPVFFVVAFSGQYSGVTEVRGFATDNILSWYTPMAVLMGAAFAGMGTAFSTARDLENGFFDRLLLAPSPRATLALGSLLAGVARASVSAVLVIIVGVVGGADVPGGFLGIVILYGAAMGVAVGASLWGLGLVYRIQSQDAGPLSQVGVFMALFLSTAQVPLEVMVGWLHAVARINPMSHVLDLSRAGFVGQTPWAEVWPGLVALAGFWLVLGAFALRGMRKLIP